MNNDNKQKETAVTILEKPSQAVVGFDFFDEKKFETIQRVCKMFACSELVPDMYKTSEKNPQEKAMANCMIALEVAQRIGASPLMVMQNMIIIYGRPSWSSKFLIATVNSCGRFNPLQYRFTEKGMLGMVDYTEYNKTWVQGSNGGKGYYRNDAKTSQFDGRKIMDIECVAYTTAKGSDKVLESSPISIRLAIKEGWYTKSGSKWQTMPQQMLMYRAAAFWTNAYAPELSMGMRTVEENQDISDAEYEEIPTVIDAVVAEQAANANKVEISINTGETVDTETGEVSPTAPEQVAEPVQIEAPF